ncbi:RNA-dependent RNA polymerase [Tico virus]|uniref:RNA-directed RNA polymerase L n=1 Tax=Tico virus TaxID=2846448 RepID=A0A482K9X7_9VIRU|nr:RNA-dependent RNA polymerase [Tico virus]QBQ01764.1 RNA-dependent RNA polymerase [Tico virus]
MDELIQKQPVLQDGFNKRPLVSYDDSLYNYELPDFFLQKENSGLKVVFDFSSSDPNSTVGSTLRGVTDLFIDGRDLPNLIHNLTIGHLSSNTDRPFVSVFRVMGDGFDGLTPDDIVETASGSFFIMEFTTFRGSPQGAMRAAMDKIGKYESACVNRSVGSKLTLSIIAVHRQGVVSNLVMDDDDVNELVFRYKLSLAIFREALHLFPTLSDDDTEMSKVERDILGIISTIEMDWKVTEKQFPYFKEKMFSDFRSLIPDQEYVSSIISQEMRRAQNDIVRESFSDVSVGLNERLGLNLEECNNAVQKFMREVDRPGQMRDLYDGKATVQIPPWVTIAGHEGKDLEPLKELWPSGDHPMISIWEKVCSNARMETIDRMHDDTEEELRFALDPKSTNPEERSRYHRTTIGLSRAESEYVATHGVRGKAHKDESQVVESRIRSKKTFSINHDISQLDSFINDRSRKLFEIDEDVYSPLSEDDDLRLSAQSIHQPTLTGECGANEFLENHRNFMLSWLGSWTQMVSLIGAELSASVKQHVKPNSFIVKRLQNSGIYMLIKPTSSVSHIFVSFAVEKRVLIGNLWNEGVFKTSIDGGDMLVTDFVSYKLSKLTNLCKCNSLVECSINFWSEAYGFDCWNCIRTLHVDRSGAGQEIRTMVKLSLLTLMEDKAATEELQTLLRYIVMEGFVSPPELPKPHKMMKKLPSILRTEFQVFLINRALQTMLRISSKPFALNKKGGQIMWSFLFNPLTGNTLKDLQPLISTCYNGYFKNKEEETEPSALSKMYKKIIELEHLCPESDTYLGYGDPVEPQMHEFSVSYLKSCTEHAKKLLAKTHGSRFMDEIDAQIMREVSSLTLERLATLKATSNFDSTYYVYKEIQDKHYSRDKLLVKMSEFAQDGSALAIQLFDRCMKKIEERGAMHICLFKKQQHGGLREIYVMAPEERIVQCIVEAIAKSVCSFFPSDTLANPANKSKIPETHGVRARKHCKGPVWTCATSDDARKWNQGHFVTKFALMLCEFTSPKWWSIIIRGCSMFTNKYMMMNMKYLEILHGKKELVIEDEFVNELHAAYHGEVEKSWLRPGETFLRTKTGMMQGILHSTSSLLHTIHQEYVRSLTFKIMNMKVHPEASLRVVCDMMQGSDDSAMILSFPSSDPDVLSRFKMAAAVCFRLKKYLGIYLAIYPSEKSTSNTDFALEYNSEFHFHSQHVRPTVRWVAACCNMPEVETLIGRQEEASNLSTAVAEGGGSFSLTAAIQHAQCTLHYMLMGMGVSCLFAEYKKAVLRWKDPGLGFFFLDNPYCAGLGGFRFNLFKAVTTTNLQKIYAYFMRKVKAPDTALTNNDDEENGHLIIPETCSVSAGGALIMSSSLKWGSREKFLKLRSRLNIPDNWVDLINMHPEVLYRAPRTGEEIMLRIAEKVHSPGVVSSLSSGNAVAKVMASAVYFLSASIFEDSGRPEFSVMNNSRYSLLQKMAAYDGFTGSGDLTDEDILFLFPNVEELRQLDRLVYDRGQIQVVRRLNTREATQTKVVVFEEHKTLRTSPEKLVSDKWFGTQKSRIGRTMFEQEWERLKTVICWLRDDHSTTLESSPLHSHVQIRNFFARLEGKSRVVRITGAPVKRRSGSSKLAMVIRDNFSKHGHLKEIEDYQGMERSQVSEVLKHTLFSILQGPYSDDAKLDFSIKVLYNSPQVDLRPQDGRTKTNSLGLLQKHLSGEGKMSDLLTEVGAGTLGGFVHPQERSIIDGKVYYHNLGVWRGVMDGVQVQIEIFNKVGMPPQMCSVIVSGKSSPWEICQSLRMWCDDMGAKNSVDFSRSHRNGRVRFWLLDFKMFGSDKAYGCPVYIERKSMTRISEISNDMIRMKVRNSTINLFMKEAGVDVHILSYTANDNDISPSSMKSKSPYVMEILSHFKRDPSASWIKCEALSVVFMNKVLDVADGRLRVPHIDSDRLKKIIIRCTESSIRSRVGTIYSSLPRPQEHYQVMDYDDVIDLMIEDFSMDEFEQAVRGLSEDLEDEYYSEEFDATDIDLFGPAHHKEMSELSLVSHPLMDEFVDSLVNKVGRKEIRRSLEQYRCYSRSRPHLETLFRALGRDVGSLKVDDFDLEDLSEPDDEMIG